MTHPGEGTLQALLDDELRPAERGAVELHLADCIRCKEELSQLRDDAAEVASAVRLLDIATPLEQARWRFEGRRRRRAPLAGAALRRAALLVVGSAAVLSATVPGSPVRAWLADSWERVAVRTTETPAPVEAPVAERVEVEESAPAGVSLRPAAQPMRVVLAGPAAGVRIRVYLHEGERVGVWATGQAAQARFRTAPDRIEVDGATAGEVRVEIPRRGPSLTLEVNGRVYLHKDGDQLRFPGPAADTVGPEILFEVRP